MEVVSKLPQEDQDILNSLQFPVVKDLNGIATGVPYVRFPDVSGRMWIINRFTHTSVDKT